MSQISIVVPVFNAREHLINLIEDLDNSEAQYVDKIFVDDASTEDTISPIIKYMRKDPKVQLLRNQVQQLYTRTVNRGIRACAGDTEYYCLLNTDVRLKPGWLNALIAKINEDPNTALVGYPDGRYPDGDDQECFYPRTEEHPDAPDYVTFHTVLISRWAFEEVGLLDEKDLNSAHIHSDRLFGYAIGSKGYRMFYVGKSLCVHDSGGASWKRDLGWLFSYPKDRLWPARKPL